MTSPQTPTEPEQEWYVATIGDSLEGRIETWVVQKMPGEARYIAEICGSLLSVSDRERYARMIVDALNAAREFVRRCEAGEILSKTSYAAFKSALEGVPRKPSTAEVVERETI